MLNVLAGSRSIGRSLYPERATILEGSFGEALKYFPQFIFHTPSGSDKATRARNGRSAWLAVGGRQEG